MTNPLVQEGCLGHSFCHLSNLVRKHVLSSVGHCLDLNTGSAGRQPRITCYLEFRNMGIHKLSLLCFVCCLLWKCPQHLLTTPKGMASALESSCAAGRKEGVQLGGTPNSVFKYRLRRFMYTIIFLFCRLYLPVTFVG